MEEKEAIWNQIKNPDFLQVINSAHISPDALAFYRPFHFYPSEDWGIYLLIDKILDYYNNLKNIFGKSLTSDILLGYILFEIFHHEFFHHIVESAATSMEVISSAFGKSLPLYLNYFHSDYHKVMGLGNHEHDPLEEALANAYAYNAFSFSSRVNKGYKTMVVKAYQKNLLKGWKYDPPGYRSAEYYINSGYIYGATQLLGMILSTSSIDPRSSSIVAKNVLFNGNSAFCAKPDIPTYLVGSQQSIEYFTKLIPAPNATYTNLFWHEDMSELDAFLLLQKKRERKRSGKK